MIRRRQFADVGGFDIRFQVAYNDLDLCLKLRAKGYRVIYTPFAHQPDARACSSPPVVSHGACREAFDVAGYLELLYEVMRHHRTGVVSVRCHVRNGIPWAVSVQFHDAEERAA